MTTTGRELNPFIEHPAKFNDRRPQAGGGVQYEFTFANGYGASVVQSRYSYGGQSGLWELAVLDAEGDLCYSTPITSDVLGWLSADDVRDALAEIASLPSGRVSVAS